MRFRYDLALLISLPVWVAMLILLYLDEKSRGVPRSIPTLGALVFGAHAEMHARKGIFFAMPGEPGRPVRVGSWRRDIRFIGDTARVNTRVELKLPDEFLAIMRDGYSKLMVGVPMVAELLEHPRIVLHSTTDLSQGQGLLVSVSQIEMLGRTVTEKRRPRDGKVQVERTEGTHTISRIEEHEWSDAEVGFYPVEEIDLEKTWDIFILKVFEGKPEVVRVRVVRPETIAIAGRKVNAFRVQGVQEPYAQLVGHYDGNGRVLREQGVFWPLTQLIFEREPEEGAADPK